MKTKLQIILETQSVYADATQTAAVRDPSGLPTCVISTSDGRHCAVGRCMTEEFQKYYLDAIGPDVKDGELEDKMLKPEYRGHDKLFWYSLQGFHDTIAGSDIVSPLTYRSLHEAWDNLIEMALIDELELKQ